MSDVYIVPPNTMARIDRIWAFLSVDKDGNEGLCAAPLAGAGSIIPLIAADPARLASITPIAERIAQHTGMTIVLVEFSARTELRTITGHADG